MLHIRLLCKLYQQNERILIIILTVSIIKAVSGACWGVESICTECTPLIIKIHLESSPVTNQYIMIGTQYDSYISIALCSNQVIPYVRLL